VQHPAGERTALLETERDRASSSSRPLASSHRTVVAQPDRAMSPSVASLTAWSAATWSSVIAVALCQGSGPRSRCVTTYFATWLMWLAKGTSSLWPGQNADHSSYSVRPIRNAFWVSIPLPMTAPISSSK
jgi:hypothetical protein